MPTAAKKGLQSTPQGNIRRCLADQALRPDRVNRTCTGWTMTRWTALGKDWLVDAHTSVEISADNTDGGLTSLGRKDRVNMEDGGD